MPLSNGSTKTILITGAAGFIGYRLTQSFLEKGATVIGVDRKLSENHYENRPEHKDGQPTHWVDLEELPLWLERRLDRQLERRQEQPLENNFLNSAPSPKSASTSPSSSVQKIDAIFHMGAIADTMEFDENLLRKMNIESSQFLWNFATEHKIPFYYASSAATYGDGSNGYNDDESKIPNLKPLNPYGNSKQIFDCWVLEQEKKNHTPPRWAGFKFFNVYGYGESHKGKMASVILHAYQQIQTTNAMKLFKSHKEGIADGHQKRDFVWVGDLVKILHFAMEKPIHRGIFNLGSGKARPFLDLAHAVFDELKLPRNIEFIPTPESIRDKYQYFTEATMDRLRSEGYNEPFASLEQGVHHYIENLKSYEKAMQNNLKNTREKLL